MLLRVQRLRPQPLDEADVAACARRVTAAAAAEELVGGRRQKSPWAKSVVNGAPRVRQRPIFWGTRRHAAARHPYAVEDLSKAASVDARRDGCSESTGGLL